MKHYLTLFLFNIVLMAASQEVTYSTQIVNLDYFTKDSTCVLDTLEIQFCNGDIHILEDFQSTSVFETIGIIKNALINDSSQEITELFSFIKRDSCLESELLDNHFDSTKWSSPFTIKSIDIQYSTVPDSLGVTYDSIHVQGDGWVSISEFKECQCSDVLSYVLFIRINSLGEKNVIAISPIVCNKSVQFNQFQTLFVATFFQQNSYLMTYLNGLVR